MALKALSFLGTGNYKETTYVDKGREYKTGFIQQAICNWYNPDQLYILATPQVKKHQNMALLESCIGKHMTVLNIPSKQSKEDIWEIFEACTSVVDEGDSIIVDITHGFRSLPLVGFAIAAFLQRVKDVQVKHVLYGCYEDRHENCSPVYDLAPIIHLLNWADALKTFASRGDAKELAVLLSQAHQEPWQAAIKEKGQLPRLLKNLSRQIKDLSEALHLSRPLDVMSISKVLSHTMDEVSEEGEAQQWAKPFALVLEKFRDELTPLAAETPYELSKRTLKAQLALTKYYLNRDLLVQAVTLMREWVVNYMALKLGVSNWLALEERNKVADVLRCSDADDYAAGIASLWGGNMTRLRNDVAHSGFNDGPAKPETIKECANQLHQILESLLVGAGNSVLTSDTVTLDLQLLFGETASLAKLPYYIDQAQALAGVGKNVILTGQAPIWLYLSVAHALHGKASSLTYSSPVAGKVEIFHHK